MQEELSQFLTMYGEETESLYGIAKGTWISNEIIKQSPIWVACSEMYDYGIMGTPTGDLVPGSLIDGNHAITEKFFRGIDTPAMQLFLNAVGNHPPRLAIKAAQSAIARIVLDGGDRYTDFGIDAYGIKFGDRGYLTLHEVSLLADMDEKSVRNAANPKLSDPLKTEQIGKRSLVSVEEARRWLPGRKGFVPTHPTELKASRPPYEFNLTLTQDDGKRLMKEAEIESKKTGIPLSICWEAVAVKFLHSALHKKEEL